MGCVSEVLRKEHETILFGLSILEHMSELVLASSGYEVDDLKETVDFFRLFADQCHHGKEEEILFPAMVAAGIPNESGPVGRMLEEHDLGRSYIAGMVKAIENDNVDKDEFSKNAESYIQLMREHINKENKILFPIGDRKIPVEKHESIRANFKRFEYENPDVKTNEEVHDFIDYMEAKYLR